MQMSSSLIKPQTRVAIRILRAILKHYFQRLSCCNPRLVNLVRQFGTDLEALGDGVYMRDWLEAILIVKDTALVSGDA